MARLPEPGKDQGTWGDILNDYLSQTHNPDGSLKNASVTEANLATAVQTKLNQVAPSWSTLSGKPAVIAAGADAAAARASIGAGTASTKSDVGLGNVDNTSDANKPISAAVQAALNNKADVSAVSSGVQVATTPSSVTPAINTDDVDMFGITAQSVDITSMSTNMTGTPTNGQMLWIYIVGTAARAITWGTKFEEGAAPLPTTTVSTQRLDVVFVWNIATSRWRCMASGSA